MLDLSKQKLELNYPCSWSYKLIVLEKININEVVESLIFEREYSLRESKTSSKGKYKSYSLDLLVHNEEDRKELYGILGNHTDIKMVL